MTNPAYRHLIIVIDRSGSMSKIQAGMQSGFEEFTGQQRQAPGKTTISLYQFDDTLEQVSSFSPLDEVAGWQLQPRGTTDLYGAVVVSVGTEGKALGELHEDKRPGKVILMVITDGLQTSPSEYTAADLKRVVTHQREVYGWEVIYLGTNQDAIAEGEKAGVSYDTSLSYANDNDSTHGAWQASSSMLNRTSIASANGQPVSYVFTDEERKIAANRGRDSGDGK